MSKFIVFRIYKVCLLLIAVGNFITTSAVLTAEPPKLALLVGCTKYANYPDISLRGPANDVTLWTQLLVDPHGFAFPSENIASLSGWPDDESKRPTCENIKKQFENLILKAEPDSQVFIMVSGHGIQVPIPTTQVNPLDPKNPEPDGMDSAFLPADVMDFAPETGLKNCILDNQFGEWLDKIREKGAHVMIVFDQCHSGDMTRGVSDTGDVVRSVPPSVFGIKDDAVESAARRARKAVEIAAGAGLPTTRDAAVVKAKAKKGSLAALFACQRYENALESPLPKGAARNLAKYYGLFNYSLIEVLKRRTSGLTYAELQRLVNAQIRAQNPINPQCSYVEGDVNREVLGMNNWPARPKLYIERDNAGHLCIAAGTLHGIADGSILSVLPPPNDPRDPATILGYVAAYGVSPYACRVSPATRGPDAAEPPIALDDVPIQARCELVSRPKGRFSIQMCVKSPSLRAILQKLVPEVQDTFMISNSCSGGWMLRVVTAREAQAEYGIAGLTQDAVFLLRIEKDSRVWGQYPFGDESALIRGLERDLPKLYRWINLWSLSTDGRNHDIGLKLEARILRSDVDREGVPIDDDGSGVLHSGQQVVFRLENKSAFPQWVSVFHMGADLGIRQLFSGGVKAESTIDLARVKIVLNNGVIGKEGLVVFAQRQTATAAKPDYSVVEQEPLNVSEVRTRGINDLPQTPFGKLIGMTVFNKGTRGIEVQAPSIYDVQVETLMWKLQR